jgi:hypothetical protein
LPCEKSKLSASPLRPENEGRSSGANVLPELKLGCKRLVGIVPLVQVAGAWQRKSLSICKISADVRIFKPIVQKLNGVPHLGCCSGSGVF